jgi:hypothetical protein
MHSGHLVCLDIGIQSKAFLRATRARQLRQESRSTCGCGTTRPAASDLDLGDGTRCGGYILLCGVMAPPDAWIRDHWRHAFGGVCWIPTPSLAY